MRTCWASSIGDCEGNISREHIVSQSIFYSKRISVQGFDWCKDSPKRVSLASLTKNCLCEKHNSKLSPLDSAAGHFFRVLRDADRFTDGRLKSRKKSITHHVNAVALERWLIKTLINISYGSDKFIGSETNVKGIPGKGLVQAAYGMKSLNRDQGMRVGYREGQNVRLDGVFKCTPVLKDEEIIIGARFELSGLLLFLDLASDSLKVPFSNIPGTPENWHNLTLSKDFKHFEINTGGQVSQKVKFNWKKRS